MGQVKTFDDWFNSEYLNPEAVTAAYDDWFNSKYLNPEAVTAAYEKAFRKNMRELEENLIKNLKENLSICSNCSSYATCHRENAKICNKAAQLNDAITKTVRYF